MQILTIIVPHLRSKSNLFLSCKTLYEWLSNNGFQIETNKKDLSLQNLDYCLSLSYPKEELCMWAAYNGDIPLIKLLEEEEQDYYEWDDHVYGYAALAGQLECLKWLWEQECKDEEPEALYAFNNPCEHAAFGGHKEVLEWLREQGCEWSGWTCANAAAGGQLETLKWLRANGCPFNKWSCAHAAGEGQLECLKWLREQGCEWDKDTYKYAASHGQTEIIKWLRENGAPPEWFEGDS